MAEKKATPGNAGGKKPLGNAPPGQGQAARPLNPNNPGKNKK
jgi:hypothetical protein